MTTFFPLSRCHCPAMSSSAFFRLAAANTRTSLPCATAGKAPAVHANPAATKRASQAHLVVTVVSIFAIFFRAYRGANIAGFPDGSIGQATQIAAGNGGCGKWLPFAQLLGERAIQNAAVSAT